MNTQTGENSRRWPTLDGIRGLAIIMVLSFHFTDWSNGSSQWLRAGWVGVDLFFVLSGFLITGILIDTRQSPRYFRSFYARRALRIFPLYYAVLVVIFLLGPWIGLAKLPGFSVLVGRQAWFWTYTSNVYLSLTGRIDLNASWLDLNHFWSLAIEEHFYLVWPAVVVCLSGRALIRACLACMVVALLVRVGMIVIWSRPVATYFLTICRIDSLAVGGLMAVLARGEGGLEALGRPARSMALVGGLVLMALGLRSGRIAAADRLVQMVGFSALGIGFAGVIVLVASAKPGQFWFKIWTCSVLTTLGRYSYGIYVYHQIFGRKLVELTAPALEWAGPVWAPRLMVSVGILINLAIAALSFHLFEARFLRLKARFVADLPPTSASSPDRMHQTIRLDESRGVDFVPLPLLGHGIAKGLREDDIRRTGAE
jgi:peptidoglycan/LPS O-acetylase OafA/YrhL